MQKASKCKLRSRKCISCMSLKRVNSSDLGPRFKELLCNVGSQISAEDLSALKFLCQDMIVRRKLEGISSGLEIFRVLHERGCISAKRPQFLQRILQDCGRSDLAGIVECSMHPQQEGSREPPAADDSTIYSAGNHYLFRRALKALGDKLGHADLQGMKIIARCCIPDSKMEKAETVFDFFILLEEHGKLCSSNLSFLAQLIEDKIHLVHPLYKLGFGQGQPTDSGVLHRKILPTPQIFTSPGPDLMMQFKKLLKTIGVSLTSHDFQQLQFLCSDAVGASSSQPSNSATDLLIALEKLEVVSPTNVDFLMENLEHIGRRDLCSLVARYKQFLITSDKCREGNVETDKIGQLQQRLREMEKTLQLERIQHHQEKAQLQATMKTNTGILTRKVVALESECAKLYQKLTHREERIQTLTNQGMQKEAEIDFLQKQLRVQEWGLCMQTPSVGVDKSGRMRNKLAILCELFKEIGFPTPERYLGVYWNETNVSDLQKHLVYN